MRYQIPPCQAFLLHTVLLHIWAQRSSRSTSLYRPSPGSPAHWCPLALQPYGWCRRSRTAQLLRSCGDEQQSIVHKPTVLGGPDGSRNLKSHPTGTHRCRVVCRTQRADSAAHGAARVDCVLPMLSRASKNARQTACLRVRRHKQALHPKVFLSI